MPRGALGGQASSAQRHRRDERHRGRRDRDEQRGDEVGVGERRRLAGAEPAREAVRDDVEPLDREGQSDPFGQATEPGADRAAGPPDAAPARKANERDADRERPVQREAPAERLHAVIDEHRDHDEADDRAGSVPERGGAVVVERGERARGDPGVDLQRRCGDQPGQERSGARLRLRIARQQPGNPVRGGDRDRREGHERESESERPGADLATELAGPLSTGELGQHDDAQRARDENDRDVDEVRGEKPVRLDAVAELPREDRAGERRRAADGRGREPGQEAAMDRAPAT